MESIWWDLIIMIDDYWWDFDEDDESWWIMINGIIIDNKSEIWNNVKDNERKW